MNYQIVIGGDVEYATAYLIDADIILEVFHVRNCLVIDSTTGEVVRIVRNGETVYKY